MIVGSVLSPCPKYAIMPSSSHVTGTADGRWRRKGGRENNVPTCIIPPWTTGTTLQRKHYVSLSSSGSRHFCFLFSLNRARAVQSGPCDRVKHTLDPQPSGELSVERHCVGVGGVKVWWTESVGKDAKEKRKKKTTQKKRNREEKMRSREMKWNDCADGRSGMAERRRFLHRHEKSRC